MIPLILLSLIGSAQDCDSLKKNYAKTIKYAIELEGEICKRDSVILIGDSIISKQGQIIAIQDTLIVEQHNIINKLNKSLKWAYRGLFVSLGGILVVAVF